MQIFSVAQFLYRSHDTLQTSHFSCYQYRDDVIKWKLFPCYMPFVTGNPLVTGGFPSQRPVTQSFDVFCDLRLNKRLGKQSRRWWFDTPSRSLWRQCNDEDTIMLIILYMKLTYFDYFWYFQCAHRSYHLKGECLFWAQRFMNYRTDGCKVKSKHKPVVYF